MSCDVGNKCDLLRLDILKGCRSCRSGRCGLMAQCVGLSALSAGPCELVLMFFAGLGLDERLS